jgi:hypothetical protein
MPNVGCSFSPGGVISGRGVTMNVVGAPLADASHERNPSLPSLALRGEKRGRKSCSPMG